MILSKTALIFALAPIVSFPATLISQTREVSATAAAFPDPFPVTDTETTLLPGYALLEVFVEPVPDVNGGASLESVISPHQMWAKHSAGGGSFPNPPIPGFGAGFAMFEAIFEVTDTEIWDLEVFLNVPGSLNQAASTLSLTREIKGVIEGVAFYSTIGSPDEIIVDSKQLLLTPGIYTLRLDSDGGGADGAGGDTSGSFSLVQVVPEPSTYLSVSVGLAVLLLGRQRLVKGRVH